MEAEELEEVRLLIVLWKNPRLNESEQNNTRRRSTSTSMMGLIPITWRPRQHENERWPEEVQASQAECSQTQAQKAGEGIKMATKIDRHPQGKIIIKRLASGEQNFGILPDFPGITGDDLDYYRDHKLPDLISKSPELKAEIEGDLGNDTLAEVRALKEKAVDILSQAQGAGDLKTALLGIREARGCLEAILKAGGRIQEQNINIIQQNVLINNPEWIELRTLIIKALEPYPKARETVMEALDRKQRR